MTCSVLILIKGRQDHLARVLDGLSRSTRRPDEVIIVHMNEPITDLHTNLPIKQFSLHSAHPLPLAAARNRAAADASSEQLVFLDVDCIPGPDSLATMLTDLESAELVMADPRYLQAPITAIDVASLEANSTPNPARADLVFGPSDKYELFWSLGFAIRATDFQKIGGFDEGYVGYGGEDTDFAFRARQHGLRLCYSQARVYHQDHPSYDPPLNWLEDIVTNARHFKTIWGDWPMRGWLQKFQEQGYIDWRDDMITVLKLPTESEVAAARKLSAL